MVRKNKYRDIKYLKTSRVLLDREREKLLVYCLDEEGETIREIHSRSDIDYYAMLTDTINKIDTYLEKEKDYIRKQLIKELEKTNEMLFEYNNGNVTKKLLDELKEKIILYKEEMNSIRNPKYSKIYYGDDGEYVAGLKDSNDLELYYKLEQTIKNIEFFLFNHRNTFRYEMSDSLDKINDIVDFYLSKVQ